jgi:pimeloyl-ACP methyl ester carboxylesterase
MASAFWLGRDVYSRAPLRTCQRVSLVFLALLGVFSGCTRTAPPTGLARLHPCATSEGPTDAACGILEVWENREARSGRRISLNIVALPSLAAEPAPDPLFFLAGGPGQAAAQMATQIREIFRPILRQRDIILVDQRGTGKSNPLECHSPSNTLQELTETDDQSITRLRTCLAGYKADVRFYTTSIAMADLDDVRAYLGFEHINLYGGSYGTRAALEYLRRYGGRVRSVVLDGVAPTDMRIPLFAARDAQRALDKLLTDCEADKACRTTHPGLAARVRALLQRLSANPARVEVMHPRTGIRETVTIHAGVVAGVVFGALYSPLTASLVPTLIARAEQNDFQNLLALAYADEGSGDNMSVGMQLSVLCSEDATRVTADDVGRESEGTVFAQHLLRGQLKACEIWPRGKVDESYYRPVTSEVPTLVLSGDLDPVTPPGWGDAAAKQLKNAVHITVPATGHGVIGTPCGQQMIRDFIERGTAKGLDASCVGRIRRPPFFLTPSGAQ